MNPNEVKLFFFYQQFPFILHAVIVCLQFEKEIKSSRCVVPPMSDARIGSNLIIAFLCDFKYCWIVGPVLATFLFISWPDCAIYPFIKELMQSLLLYMDRINFAAYWSFSPKLKYLLCLYSPLCQSRLWCHSLMHITIKGFHRGKEFHPMPTFVLKRSN